MAPIFYQQAENPLPCNQLMFWSIRTPSQPFHLSNTTLTSAITIPASTTKRKQQCSCHTDFRLCKAASQTPLSRQNSLYTPKYDAASPQHVKTSHTYHMASFHMTHAWAKSQEGPLNADPLMFSQFDEVLVKGHVNGTVGKKAKAGDLAWKNGRRVADFEEGEERLGGGDSWGLVKRMGS